MKRLLCIVGGMNVGGAETFLMKIYRALDKTKYQMDFAVSSEKEGYYDKEIKKLGGKIYKITPKTKGIVKNFMDIKNIVKDNSYDYVLRISQHSLSANELLAAKLGGAKIRCFRSSNSNTTTGGGTDLLLHKVFGFMPKCFANVKIAPSGEAAEFMFGKRACKSGKVSMLRNAVDLNVFKFDVDGRASIRKEFGLDESTFLFGHVGRFTTQKNHVFLLDVFSEIVKQKPDSKLMLVGKGELENQIREKAESLGITEKVIFTGVRSDIPQLLSAMDAFVFPSLYDGMPNAVIEAQAIGLPCVISDTITKEANITGLVRYLPIDSPMEWAECASAAASHVRKDTKQDFVNNKYDIKSSANEFVKLVFGDEI